MPKRRQRRSAYATTVYGTGVNLDAADRIAAPIHYCRDATAITSMADAIGSLPTPTEAIHLWIGGQHSMGHVLPAVLELAPGCTIDSAHICTLTFSKDNAAEWAALKDEKAIGSLSVICSHYFSKTSQHIYDYAADLFAPRGIVLNAIRSHCKLLAVRLSDGRTVSAEGSANTRSARTVENLVLFGNPEVYRFHVTQIERAKTWTKDRGAR